MIVYRITTKPYIQDLSGTGAMRYGGRWNPKGKRMLYTSSTISLAMLEVMVNIGTSQLSRGYYCAELEYPDTLSIDRLANLPENWNAFPHTNTSVKIGASFLEQGAFCLRVPSAIVSGEFNFLFNPIHDDFHQLRVKDIKPLIFDQRLWR